MTDIKSLVELLRTGVAKGGMCDSAADLIEQQAARIAELEAEKESSRPVLKWFNDQVWFDQERIAELEAVRDALKKAL